MTGSAPVPVSGPTTPDGPLAMAVLRGRPVDVGWDP